MNKTFTYLQEKKQIEIIDFLDKEIASLDSLIDLQFSLKSNKK